MPQALPASVQLMWLSNDLRQPDTHFLDWVDPFPVRLLLPAYARICDMYFTHGIIRSPIGVVASFLFGASRLGQWSVIFLETTRWAVLVLGPFFGPTFSAHDWIAIWDWFYLAKGQVRNTPFTPVGLLHFLQYILTLWILLVQIAWAGAQVV